VRQLRRLNSAHKSPIFSHFGESLSGVVTIRSFDRTRRFVQEMEAKIDNSSLFYYPDAVSYRWLGMRLELIGGLVTFFACLFTVLGRASIVPATAGLTISYALTVTPFLPFLSR